MLHLQAFIFLLTLCNVHAQFIPYETDVSQMKCYDDQNQPKRCVPEFVNAAFYRRVNASNTCGTPATEYCDQTKASGQTKQCAICDANIPELSHTSFYITDSKVDKNLSWWQSDTLYTLRQNNIYDEQTRRAPVTLYLDLGKTYEVVSIRLRFRSLRPESMAIYKKTSAAPNSPWIPYQYFSKTCLNTYGVEPDAIVTRNNLQTALCTGKYSRLTPITLGEVLFTTLEHRPGRDEIEELVPLQEWIRAYSLRFDLTRLNTFGDEIFGDPKVLRSYYYAIIDLTVVGKCDCNGHASECVRPTQVNATTKCICQHNTNGTDCERCASFYNNKPWAKATSTNANACEACDCNGLADACDFDMDLYQRTGKGGRCLNCRNNTGGPFCEKCQLNYYRENDNEQCKPCNCNPIGSQTLECYKDGRCYCKAGVTGDKCDRCRPNHYGFSQDGCSPCECSVLGTRADSFQCAEDGSCTCKKNVIGKNCDQCLAGYFALEADNPYGCRQCFCYGHSSECKSTEGVTAVNLTSVFRFGVEEWKALNTRGQDVTEQLVRWDLGKQFVRVTSINQDSIYLSAPKPYLGDKKTSYSRVLSFRFKVADTTDMDITQEDIIIEAKDNLRISTSLTAQGNPLPTRSFQRYQFRLHEDPSFDWEPQLSAYKFQRLLNDITEIKIRMTYSDQGTGFIDDISMIYAKNNENAVDFVNWMEQCTCPPNYVGLSCEECRDGHKHETVNGSSYDRCVRCECNNHADKCDPDTGKCVCLHNTVGDDCSRCKDGYYGNPTIGSEDDCKPCTCVVGNNCVQIGNKVKCICPEGYQGDSCDKCMDGFYGDPTGSRGPKTRCKKCDCNGNIDTNAVRNCDSETGKCIKCIYNTRNGPLDQCEQCEVGYYGDATSLTKPGCKACDCHENGTFVSSTIDSNQAIPCNDGKCLCRPNVIGDKCDQCVPEYWNINSKKGCEPCKCDDVGSYNNTCDMTTGKCACKSGVGGRICDRCLPDHYRFTINGCKPCNCNAQGSLKVSCDENGKCVCRPGVLGEKCDECGENRFNLSAGCTRCPPCYDKLKEKVDHLRALLESLNKTGGISGTGGNVGSDKEFLKKLNQIRDQLLLLLTKVEHTSMNDHQLMKHLDILNATLLMIETQLMTSHTNVEEAEGHGYEAEKEVGLSKESIERSWELVMKLGLSANLSNDILDEISRSIKNWSVSTITLRETTKEIRNLADKQWKEVEELERMAHMAWNTSKKARREVFKAAVKKQNETEKLIEMITNDINDAKKLGQLAFNNASTALKNGKNTHSKSKKMEEKSKNPLEEIDIEGTRKLSSDITKEAKKVQNEAKRLANITVNQGGTVDDTELEKKKKILYQKEERTYKLLEIVKEANKTAHFAIINGTEALKSAQNTLEKLENFNKLVNKSRIAAEKAKLNLTEIEELISSAVNKTTDAVKEIGNAVDDVATSKTESDQADKTSEENVKESGILEDRAEELEVPDDTVHKKVKEAEKKFNKYEKQANDSSDVVQTLKKDAKDSKNVAEKAEDKVVNVSRSIVELSASLSDLVDLLDYDLLEKLETHVAEQKKKDDKLKSQIDLVKRREKKIKEDIRKYQLQIGELEEALAKLQKNRKIIPGVCMKPGDNPN